MTNVVVSLANGQTIMLYISDGKEDVLYVDESKIGTIAVKKVDPKLYSELKKIAESLMKIR